MSTDMSIYMHGHTYLRVCTYVWMFQFQFQISHRYWVSCSTCHPHEFCRGSFSLSENQRFLNWSRRGSKRAWTANLFQDNAPRREPDLRGDGHMPHSEERSLALDFWPQWRFWCPKHGMGGAVMGLKGPWRFPNWLLTCINDKCHPLHSTPPGT